jgi:hypothetical protein
LGNIWFSDSKGGIAVAQQTEALTGVSILTEQEGRVRRRSNLWRDAWHRLIRNKLAVVGMAMVTVLLLCAIFADVIMPKPRDKIYFGHQQEAPSSQFLLGTDFESRDMLSRLIYGARIAVMVGVCTQIIILLLGVSIGALAGYFGGQVDNALMRVVDIWYAVPTLLFAMLIMIMLGQGLFNLFLAIGLIQWVTLSRLVRGQLLSLREKEFIKAARVAGTGGFGIAAECPHAHHRRRDLRYPAGDLHGGAALLLRHRHQPAHAQLGADGGPVSDLSALSPAHGGVPGDRHRLHHARLHLLRGRAAGCAGPEDESVDLCEAEFVLDRAVG